VKIGKVDGEKETKGKPAKKVKGDLNVVIL
jgi:hypothetical protein